MTAGSDVDRWHRFLVPSREPSVAGLAWITFKDHFGQVFREEGIPAGVELYRESAESYLLSPAAAALCFRSVHLRDYWEYLTPLEDAPAVRPRDSVVL